MGILIMVGVLKAKAIATIYRFLWLTHLVRLFKLKTCSGFNLKSLIYGIFDYGGGFEGKSNCDHLPVPVVDSFGTCF
jgi:hypothetical protein